MNDFISFEKASELADYSILPLDVVMTRKGTVGNCAVYPQGWKLGIMHSDLLRIRLDHRKCLPVFLAWQLSLSRDIDHQITALSSGAVMAGINVSRLKEIRVFIPPMILQSEFAKVVNEAAERWPDVAVALEHRLGRVPIGEASIAIAAAAPHRAEAFEVCRFVIDEVKVRVPIWKREFLDDGDTRWRSNEETSMGS